MKIALATRDNPLGRYFVNKLCSLINVDLVLIEKPKFKPKFIWKKIKQIGLFSTMYAGYRNWLTKKRAEEFFGYTSDVDLIVDLGIDCDWAILDGSINGEYSQSLLRSHKIDLLIIFGTSILGKKVLSIPKEGVINLHTGYLPDYRGVRSEFWALLNGEPEKVGHTIHFVTREIDGGDILRRGATRDIPDAKDNIDVVKFKQFEWGVRCIPIVINSFVEHKFNSETQTGGKYYSTPRIKDWLKFYWRNLLKRLRHTSTSS